MSTQSKGRGIPCLSRREAQLVRSKGIKEIKVRSKREKRDKRGKKGISLAADLSAGHLELLIQEIVKERKP